jgi:hypothetical protein
LWQRKVAAAQRLLRGHPRVFSHLLHAYFLHGLVAGLAPATIATRYQLLEADCALFPAAASFTPNGEETVPNTGRFTPTRQQVAMAEKALPTVRLQDIYAAPPLSYYANYPTVIKENLKQYQRQYYGFYNTQHQPCLFINFFIEHYEEVPGQPAIWLRRRIRVYDGGAAFWRVYYNVTTHTLYNFSHNLEG